MIGALLDRNPRFANWLYGFTPPERGTVVLVHRRVYIVPVRLGFLFCVMLLVLLTGSINYALSLGFALTFVLAGLGLVGMVHTARNLARVAVSVGRTQPVFAGEAAQFRLILDGRVPFDRPAILARHLASGAQLVIDIPAAAVVEAVLSARPTLGADQTAALRMLVSSGRGVEVVVGRAGTGKTFLLGAVRDCFEQSGHPVPTFFHRRARQQQWVFNILVCAQDRQQVEVLKNKIIVLAE